MAHRISKKAKKGRSWQSSVLRALWLIAGGVVLAITLIFLLLSFSNLPSFEELENPDIDLATTVYSKDRKELGRYYVENRVPIAYDSLNPHLVNALISTEDIRYYSHSGIDFQALARVGVRTVILQQESSGGGSTISQQLAKLLFPRENLGGMGKIARGIKIGMIKFKEWITAVKLEKRYTKEEIIAMYLNEFDFIYGAHGVHSASETYFGKDQSELKPEEAAVLIGMLKNPSLYNPKKFPENARRRRNTVLRQMQKAGHIDETEYELLSELPIDMSRFERSTHITGIAPYLRAELAKDLKEILDREAYTKPDGNKYNIYRDGLKVYTTIDYEMQRIAEDVMKDHMKVQQERFFDEWKGKDPWEYRDNKIPVELKKEHLQSLIEESERYQKIRDQMLGDLLADVEEKYDSRLRPVDIRRMREEEERRGTLTRLIANNQITAAMADDYRAVLQSGEWKELMERWGAFEARVDEEFNRKVDMQVFAYNKGMEKDTVMTPLDSIKYHRMHLQTGILAIDPDNGEIRVWVGGINHKYFKYDHIETYRQVGSTFKPYIYASAILFKGISPCYKVEDVPYTIMPGEANFDILEPWTPRNASGEYTRESIPLYDCLRRSINTASVFLMKQLGDTDPVRGLVHNMGIDSSIVRYDGEFVVPDQPSICLGSADLTVMQMTGAYATFANQGVYNKPVLIERIEDKYGKVIYKSIPKEQVVLDPGANYVMVDMLRYATSGAPGFQGVKSEFGGKTGTTNDYTDGWFMGITPNLVVGTWVGGEDRWVRFRSFSNGQGSRMARPFFAEFLRRIEQSDKVDYDPSRRFVKPDHIGIEINCQKYSQFDEEGDENKKGNELFEEDFGEDL